MQQENPKISVIVPIYKVEKYLNECVDSILAQTYTNLEVILVDDGSPDSCPQICDNYAKQDARVVVVHQENGGLSAARNRGMEVATGEYLSFVDSDDYIAEDMLEFLYCNLKEHDADIAECSYYMVYGNKIVSNESDVCVEYSAEEALGHLLINKNSSTCVWNKLYKRVLYQNITFPVGKWFEDVFTTYKILHCCSKIVYLQKPKYFYRKREGAITTAGFNPQNLDVLAGNVEIEEFILKNYPKLSVQAQFSTIYASVFVYGSLIKSKQPTKENKELLASFEQSLRSKAPKYLKNPFLTKREKMVLRLLCLNKTVCKQASRFYFYVKSRTNKVEQ